MNEIVLGKRGITADTAQRLSRFFGTSDRFWLDLQVRYDLEVGKDRLGARIKREVPVFAKAGQTVPASPTALGITRDQLRYRLKRLEPKRAGGLKD